MSEDKHGLESVSAWIESKLRVRYLTLSYTAISTTNVSPKMKALQTRRYPYSNPIYP